MLRTITLPIIILSFLCHQVSLFDFSIGQSNKYDSESLTNYKLDLYLKTECTCIKIKQCRTIIEILAKVKKPLSNYSKEKFRKTMCDFQDGEPTICCAKISDNQEEIISSRIQSGDESSPLEHPWIWDSSKRNSDSSENNSSEISSEEIGNRISDYHNEYSQENLIDFEDPYTHKNCPPIFGFDKHFNHFDNFPHNRHYNFNDSPPPPPPPYFDFHPHFPYPSTFPTSEYPHRSRFQTTDFSFPPGFPQSELPPHPHHQHHHHQHHQNPFHNHINDLERGFHTKSPKTKPPKKFDSSKTQSTSVTSLTSTEFKRSIFNKQMCGVSIGQRIISNLYSQLGQFPWLARIAYRNLTSGNINYRCIGSLIHEKYILTAAHCITNLLSNLQVSHVRLSEVNSNSFAKDYQIEKLIAHSLYDRPKYANDIGIIKIIRSTEDLTHRTPLCLPMENIEKNITGQMGIVAGWQTKQPNSLVTQNPKEQWVQLPIIDNPQCARQYSLWSANSKNPINIIGTQLCAQGSQNNDACQGDSGGPLMIEVLDKYTILGIVSFGPRTCGFSSLPGVYTRVSSFTNWIMENVEL